MLTRYLLIISSILSVFCGTVTAQVDDTIQSEVEFYQQNGLLPFVADEQDGDYPAGTYLVLHDLTIAKGKIMTLYPGTKILFVKDTRLIVNGILICQGKAGDQVVFDKLDNSKYFNPVDSSLDTWWDGIYISDSATVEMKHVSLRNSKNGISASPFTASVSLDTVVFSNSRFHSLRLGSETPAIANNKSISINWSGFDSKKPQIIYPDTIKSVNQNIAIRSDGTVVQLVPVAPQETRRSYKKGIRWLSASLAVIGAAGAAGGIYYAYKYNDDYEKHNLSGVDDPSYVKSLRDKGNTCFGAGIGGAALFVVGAAGFILTLTY